MISGRSDLRDADWVQQRCEQVLGQALYWFPVRHHSPAVARHVEAAILARRPKLVFLEGPAEAGSLVPHLVDSRTKPPVAIYSSYRDDDNVLGLAGVAGPAADVPARFACWYPLTAYSPEYVTLLAAKKIGAQVVFIDLPHYAELKPAAEATAKANGGREPTDSPPQARPRRDDDRLLAESSFYQALAESAGYRSWNEAWDTLFEFGQLGEDYEAFRRELAAFCCAARATSDPQRIAADGTLDRERFMLRTIRASLAGRRVRPEQALVVCGGFHLFLDQDDTTPPPAIPPGTVYTTVVPYSYFRARRCTG